MSKLRCALVGFGFIAERGHLPAYMTRGDVDVVAVADISPERRTRAAALLPDARLFETYAALLNAPSQNLDFVDICAPPYVHAEVAIAAMDAGLHVLCEKPLATSAQEAQAMLAKASQAGRVLFPAHNYRHAPVVKAIRNVLEEGLIGPVHLVTLDTFRATHARGVTEWNEHWRRDPRFGGGGIAMDHGPHTFYLAFDWLRAYPQAIAATLSTRHNATTEETFSATVTFPTGQALVRLTWASGMRKVIYTLHGSRGALRVEDDKLELSMLRSSTDAPNRWETVDQMAPSEWMDAGHSPWFVSLIDDLRDAIAKNEFVSKSARDAFACIELIEAGYRSARGGGAELSLSR